MNGTEILQGNELFRARGEHKGLVMMPRRRVMIIGCADPRVNPEKVLGLHLGDAAVIRNIGGRVTAATLATVAGLGRLGARASQAAAASGHPGQLGMDLIVLHHTDCGILALNNEPEALAGFLGTDLAHLNDMAVADPHAAVGYDVAVLAGLGLPGLRIWGLVYDVATGTIEIAVAANGATS